MVCGSSTPECEWQRAETRKVEIFSVLINGYIGRLFGPAAGGAGEHFWVTSYFRERTAENALENQTGRR